MCSTRQMANSSPASSNSERKARNCGSAAACEALERRSSNLSSVSACPGANRIAWAIQKSTELGVSRITPFFSARGEKLSKDRSANRLEHWRRIAISAVEQSGGFRIPEISAPRLLDEVLQDPARPECERLLFDPAGAQGLPSSLPGKSLRMVTGPEGGFAEPELKLAARCGYRVVRLGPRILRTETAPLAALAILQHRFGDMGPEF